MKKLIILLLICAALVQVDAQRFDLIFSPDSTEFVLSERGDNEVFSDSATISNQILDEIKTAYDVMGRNEKFIFLNQQKANTLNAALRKIYPDSSYAKNIKSVSNNFSEDRKFTLRVGNETYQCKGQKNGRIKHNASNQYWTVNVYSDLYIRINRIDFEGEKQSFYLFELDDNLYRTSLDSPVQIVLRRR